MNRKNLEEFKITHIIVAGKGLTEFFPEVRIIIFIIKFYLILFYRKLNKLSNLFFFKIKIIF
jgi:hypothetical protein